MRRAWDDGSVGAATATVERGEEAMATTEQRDRPGAGALEAPGPEASEPFRLVGYRASAAPAIGLVPAAAARDWMNATGNRFAYRCLPLVMANQAGWFLLNSHTFRATWNGAADKDAIALEFLSGEAPYPATSHFGYGVLTWHVPYLFRTPPGYNLLARGPANLPREGAFALEGLVETDWSMATFTMNWKMTAIDRPVTFEAGEPFCQLVPQRRGELEEFRAEVRELGSDPETERGYQAWNASRSAFLSGLAENDPAALKLGWQKHYFRGTTPDGEKAPTHQTKLRLGEVDDPAGWSPPDHPSGRT